MKLPRISRRDDPASSVAAEVEMNVSGKRETQMRKVLAAIKKWPGSTSRELGTKIDGMDRYDVARRTSDLESTGEVRKGPIRQCMINGRLSCVWYANNKEHP